MAKKTTTKATKHAVRPSGRSGVPPPVDYMWKPGQSGNPSGRPKGLVPISVYFQRFMMKSVEELERLALNYKRLKGAEAIALRWALDAASNKAAVSIAGRKEALERTEGKVAQPVEMSGDLDIGMTLTEASQIVDELKNGNGHSRSKK